MHTRSKLMLVALASALLLAAAVGSASATHLSQNEQNFKVTYSPLSFVTNIGTVRCQVTMEGSFHSRTIAKVVGTLVGYTTRVSVGTCESGTARANTETLPWHIQYAGFEGTLPNITGIQQKLIRPSFEVAGEIFGITGKLCRYTTPAQLGTNSRETTRGIVTGQTPGTESTTSETEGCPSGRQSGTGRVSTPTGGSIIVTLI